MSFQSEVDIKFSEVPIVRTANELHAATGRLVTSHYACVLALEVPFLRSLQVAFPGVEDLALRALRQALVKQNRSTRWTCDPPRLLSGPKEEDSGLHVDTMTPGIIAIGHHKTATEYGGLEATFAIPTDAYNAERDKAGLTALLRQGKTNPELAIPDSFRRVVFENGGIVAFTYVYPGALPQLHDFHSVTAYRTSNVSILKGY